MSQKVNVLLVDDIDGSEAGETIPFSLDDTSYEIDLNGEHPHELRGHLERYVKAARKVTGSTSRPAQVRRTPATDPRNKEIRDWARDQGPYVSSRGPPAEGRRRPAPAPGPPRSGGPVPALLSIHPRRGLAPQARSGPLPAGITNRDRALMRTAGTANANFAHRIYTFAGPCPRHLGRPWPRRPGQWSRPCSNHVRSMFARMSRNNPALPGTTRQRLSRFAVQPGTS